MFQPLNLLLVTGNILVPIGRGELPVEIQNGLDLADGEPPSEKDQDRLSVEGEERQHAFPAQDLRPPRRGYVRPGRRMALIKLSELFNHSSPSVTRRYLGLRQEELGEVYEALTF